MSLALVAMSHSPLLDYVQPVPEVAQELTGVFDRARAFVTEFDPELVITFAPDHYNGFFYEVMPPSCIGTSAFGVGDYGSAEGALPVRTDLAQDLAAHVLQADIDVAVSHLMALDHGAVQPLETLFGGVDAVPIIPVFVNGVAPPFAPMRRMRLLGEAIGRWAAARPERILLVASGGLSHDPPVPQWATADEQARSCCWRERTLLRRYARPASSGSSTPQAPLQPAPRPSGTSTPSGIGRSSPTARVGTSAASMPTTRTR